MTNAIMAVTGLLSRIVHRKADSFRVVWVLEFCPQISGQIDASLDQSAHHFLSQKLGAVPEDRPGKNQILLVVHQLAFVNGAGQRFQRSDAILPACSLTVPSLIALPISASTAQALSGHSR